MNLVNQLCCHHTFGPLRCSFRVLLDWATWKRRWVLWATDSHKPEIRQNLYQATNKYSSTHAATNKRTYYLPKSPIPYMIETPLRSATKHIVWPDCQIHWRKIWNLPIQGAVWVWDATIVIIVAGTVVSFPSLLVIHRGRCRIAIVAGSTVVAVGGEVVSAFKDKKNYSTSRPS